MAGLLLSALGALAPGAQSQSGLQPHAPIFIQGDEDLCDAKETASGIDLDGITNCDTADGSALAPYRIARWQITHEAPCSVAQQCAPLPRCMAAQYAAAISICNTTKHIALERVNVDVREGMHFDFASQTQASTSGVTLAGASNVAVRWLNVSAAGIALHVQEGRDGAGELRAAGIRIEDSRFVSLAAEAGPVSPDLSQSFLLVQDADVRMERVIIRSGERPISLDVQAAQDRGESPRHRFELYDSKLTGATETGLDIAGYDSIIVGNTFEEHGPPRLGVPGSEDSPTDQIEGINVRLNLGHHRLDANTFNVNNVGLRLETVAGRGHYNRFIAAGTRSEPSLAVVQPSNTCSQFRLTYNDVNDLRVANNEGGCTLNLPYNYWSGDAGQSSGEVHREPLLPMPVRDLPTVDVSSPDLFAGIHGKFIVRGNTTPNKGGVLDRVEATDREDEWSRNVTADGVQPWILTWDASAESLGPISLWIRACAGLLCGVPYELQLNVVERPLPPIALLEARPRVAHVGEIITLDARSSYSPQSRPVVAYRFDLGNAIKTDWVSSPLFEVRYSSPGEYPASLEILDAAGLQNNNLPQAIVRVRTNADEGFGAPRVPGFGAIAPLALLLVGALLLRRQDP